VPSPFFVPPRGVDRRPAVSTAVHETLEPKFPKPRTLSSSRCVFLSFLDEGTGGATVQPDQT